MLYELEQGGVEEFIVKAALKRGERIPDRIANAPQLMDGLDLYWEAFMDLTTDRPSGFGVGAIPWSAIKRWADHYEIGGEDFDYLVTYIRAMDGAYMKFAHKEMEKKSGK